MVMGIVSRITIGRIKALTRPSSKAAPSNVPMLRISIPGTSNEATASPSEAMIHLSTKPCTDLVSRHD